MCYGDNCNDHSKGSLWTSLQSYYSDSELSIQSSVLITYAYKEWVFKTYFASDPMGLRNAIKDLNIREI